MEILITIIWILAGIFYLGLAGLGILLLVDLGWAIAANIKRRKNGFYNRNDSWRLP